jgi:hypothetical protein
MRYTNMLMGFMRSLLRWKRYSGMQLHLYFIIIMTFQDQVYFGIDTCYWIDNRTEHKSAWVSHIYANLAAIDEDDAEMTTY